MNVATYFLIALYLVPLGAWVERLQYDYYARREP